MSHILPTTQAVRDYVSLRRYDSIEVRDAAGELLFRSARSDQEGFCQDGQHELVQLQSSWRR
jgi:hypothetical protein